MPGEPAEVVGMPAPFLGCVTADNFLRRTAMCFASVSNFCTSFYAAAMASGVTPPFAMSCSWTMRYVPRVLTGDKQCPWPLIEIGNHAFGARPDRR